MDSIVDKQHPGDAPADMPRNGGCEAGTAGMHGDAAAGLHRGMLDVSRAYAALPADKREAFRTALASRGIDGARLPIVALPPRQGRSALSYAQERLWFLWRLDPDSAAYNIAAAIRVRGGLDVAAARRALAMLGARHDILRCRFVEVDGVGMQEFADIEPAWRHDDISPTPSPEREATLARLLRELSVAPFDLQRGPVLRVTLIDAGPAEQVLHFTMHHIAADGWSLGLLQQEFARAYEAALRGVADTTRPHELQFADFARWQREWLEPAALARQLAFWRERLGTAHPVLELPMSFRRIGPRTAEGAGVVRPLGGALSQALRGLAREADATPFMVFLAAYAVLLSRYGNQQDIRIGVPESGRQRRETQDLVGFFVNTLVIRSELHGLERVADLLAHVRERVREAHAHGDVPFAAVVDALQPPRSLSHTPLFQAAMNYTAARPSHFRAADLDLESLPMLTETSRFDLTLVVTDGEEIRVGFNYSKDVFDGRVVERMLGQFEAILARMAEGGAALALADIALERDGKGHAPRADHPFVPVARRVRARAASQPAAPALHCEGQGLRYGELQQWADAIAARLRGAGVGTEHRVGLCVRRSVALPAALLGVWNAGAAFVPLDPDYPAERLAQMMCDAGVRVVLADAHTVTQLGSLLADRHVIDVAACARAVDSGEAGAAVATDHEVADGKGRSDRNNLRVPNSNSNDRNDPNGQEDAVPEADPPVHPDQLAYVIYTSGSTGTPKGVAVSQRSLSLHLDDFIQAYGIGASDIQLQLSTINFDVFLHELLPALIQGGQVRMRGPQAWDLRTTSRELADGRVTFSRIPTAYWQQWLREPPPAQALRALRQITVGGEALPGDALRQWRSGPLGHIDLDNLYGPTETTVACMARRTEEADTGQAIVCIGRPYPSRSVYVMDGQGNEVPVGALGELCIGGDTLARGYLNRPGLTAEKFIPDPYRADGARLYRSGDLCRRREDGAIDFLGRIDQQVKLRGFRIELGEIEAVLRQVPQVEEALVALRGQGEGSRLVAYIVGQADEPALRAQVSRKLPAYMAPSAYVRLDALPLMANGKLDRAALPEPTDTAVERRIVAPRSETEARLLVIWQEVLGRQDIGVTDNFFEVGGDSILSLRIIARAAQAGLGLTHRQLFDTPDIERLAHAADQHGTTGSADTPGEVRTPLPLTPIQRVFFERHPHGESHWNQSVLLKVRAAGDEERGSRTKGVDMRALRRALQLLLDRHDALRLRFGSEWDQDGTAAGGTTAGGPDRDGDAGVGASISAPDGGGMSETTFGTLGDPGAMPWRQRAEAPGTAIMLDEIDLAGDPAWRETLRQHADVLQRGLDIRCGPVVRAAYFHVGDREGRLLLIAHHLAVDGVSWRILLDELRIAYDDARAGRDTPLPPALPWTAWVTALREYASGVEVTAEWPWWRETLADARPALLAVPAGAQDGQKETQGRQTAMQRGQTGTQGDPAAMQARPTAPYTEGPQTRETPTMSPPARERRSQHVDAGLTRTLLDGAARAYRMGPDEILLAVLARAVHAATRDDDILVAVEGHGREAILPGLDLSRTVGWFTTRYPVRLRPVDALGHTLIACKETLRGVPRKGLHWGLLRAWGDAATRAEMAALPVPPIGFNYLGRFERNIDAQGRFALVGSAEGESGGRSMADDGHSPYAVDLNAMVLDGELSMDWRFDPSQYAPGLPERLVAAVDHALREIADHCATVEPTPTAADFPLARLDQRGFEALGLPTDGVQDVYPATPLQAGLLYQSLARPGEGHYVIQKRLTLAGAYDGDAMRAAWERVLAHHDVLRTRFEWRHGGGVLQIVQKEAALPYAEHDWSARDAADYDQALRAWLCDDMARGFDAAVAPLLRIAVFRRHDGACDLVWTGHHLLTDGWSSARLLGQVVACYREAAVGRVHVLPPTRPYRDYVSWLAGQPDAEGWWRDRLAKVDDPATLRQAGLCDAQSGAVNGMGEWVQCLDGVRGEALAHAARRHRVTLNTLVQGAWALLLGRCGHRRQAAFGITVSGRPPELPGMEEMLGLFINTLPLWVDLPPDMPLSRWLSSLQDANAALRQYEYTDLARLQKWAGVHGDADALFDSLVVFENYPVDPALRARTGPLALRDYGVEERTHYPLVLTASHDGQLRLHWKWDRRRIADGTAQGLARRYLDLLQRLAADGDPCLGALGLVPETEAMARAARQPAQEPATLSGAPDTEPLHRQIARQARLRPQAVALTLDGLAMTYGELDRRANRLAHRLIAQGAGPECRIGLAAPRSMALVVGMLGILKAGAAYVPLDPDYPHERLAYLIEDSGIDVLVAHPAARGSLPALSVPLVTLAPDPASLAPGNAEPKNEGAKNRDAMSADAKTGAGNKDAKIEDAEIEDAENEDPDDDARLDRDPAVPVHPDNLAYVIYTSGSTGQPKGAQLSHRNVSRLLSRTQAWFDFRSDDVWTLFHSYAFDFSVWEIFGALCHGGRLVIVPQPVSRDPAAFLALLQGERVTILNQTPSAFRPLIDAAMAASAPALDLRAVVFGGEALDPQILRPWFDRYGDARPQLVNMYGITETTVHVTYRPIVAADAARHGSPLGQPIPDLGMYVLDRDGNAAAPGIAGELYIGGAGLARGYLNRPGLTAERFVPNPHGPAGSRLYRTGDLARLQEGGGATRPRMDDAEDPVAGAPRADDVADDLQYDVQGDVRGDVPCDVHYVGRIDGQVKIRGFRIELGEVEARLRACDGVADAVAVARAQHGAMRVVAYACPPTGHTLDAGSLRDAMARQCPAHMVPAAIVVLPALPLTPNGKVDRRALPEPEFRAADDAPPMGPVEHTLAEVWQEVLGLPRVGRHDNFFALGGDSILSLQVLARASKRGLRATPRQLFEAPTIAGLTQRIADDEGPPADGAEVSTPTRTGAAGEAAMAAPGFDAASLTPRQWAQLGVDRNAIQDLYPATPLQHGMLFHNLLQDGQGVYIDQNGFRLSGALDAGALQAAWSLAVARHDILRTAFVWPPGAHAMQVVMREAVLPFQEHDWRHKSADDYEVDLETWRRKDLATAFALSRPPLLRVAVFSGPDGRHDVISTNHHVLLDGWSYAQLVGEVMAAYRAGRRNEAPSLPPPGRFRAYVDWLGRQAPPRAWWQARHAEAGEPATLGSSVLPPAAEGLYDSEHLHHLVHELDEAATIRLEQAARRYRVTVNTLVQGAWAMLLGRYASRDHAAFGITVSGRPTELPEIENVLGLFINSLPLWVDVRAGQRVGPWLAALQQRNSDARAHGHASVSQLQQWTGLSGEALFDSLIVFENYPVDRSLREGDHGLTLERLRVTERTHYPMVMVVVPVARMRFRFKFDSTRLRDAVARRLTAGFLHILDGLAGADADSVLGVIAMDRHAAPGRPRADHPFVPAARRIRARAASQPGAPALHCEGQALRYGELQQWADAIAAQLRGAGVGAEHRVGLCVRRSVALPAALLGVWNAGAAFVPLDPDYPAERLAQMMDDARVGVVLADAHTAARLGSLLGDRQVVDVASCAPPGGSAEAGAAVEDVNADRKGQNHQSQQSDQNEQPVQRDPAVHPDQLAYVIYTSGSTGTPKGVAVSQRALSLHLDDFIQTYRIGAGDIQLQLSTINFDVFLHELLPALIQGGQVRMRGPQAWDLRTTSRELAEGHVTFSRIPTAYWQQWLREPPPAQALRALRQITVGGEALPGDALRQWRSGPLGHIDLDNLYGPTETTVACMARRTGQADTAQAIVCIGQPYPSRSVYVMDGEGNEVPVGALGELCIGGDTLARGYLNRPGLTAEKFIPDPYRADGARLYRSGDLCRRREDGAIDFLGRIDQQVKLRGFRIEPGEIEAVLRQVPQVEEALVALRGQGEGSRLVAYIVGQADEPALRAQVARKLPAHMAPSAYVRLDALPLMANGKLDRAALPEPEGVVAERQAVAPRSETEARLLAIWQEVLARQDIGVTDNFFEVGGDSIAALRVIESARVAGMEGQSLDRLFRHPTIRALSDRTDEDAFPGNIVPLGGTRAAPRLFAIHPGYGRVESYRALARRLEPDIAVYGVQSPVYTEDDWWPASLQDLVRDYADRIQAVQPRGPYLLLGWSIGGAIAARVAQALEARGHAVDFLGLVDSHARPGFEDRVQSSQADAIPGPGTGGARRPRIDPAEAEALLAQWRAQPAMRDALAAAGPRVHVQAVHALLARTSYEALRGWHTPYPLRARAHLWLAGQSLAGSAEDAVRAWQALTATEVRMAGRVAAHHEDIVTAAAFLESAAAALAQALAPARSADGANGASSAPFDLATR